MVGNVVITQLLFGQIRLMLVVVIMFARKDLNYEKYTVFGTSKRSFVLLFGPLARGIGPSTLTSRTFIWVHLRPFLFNSFTLKDRLFSIQNLTRV